MTVQTTYDPPAIPCRDYDWQATFGNVTEYPGSLAPASDDDTGEYPVEFAATEQEAIQNLIDNHL